MKKDCKHQWIPFDDVESVFWCTKCKTKKPWHKISMIKTLFNAAGHKPKGRKKK